MYLNPIANIINDENLIAFPQSLEIRLATLTTVTQNMIGYTCHSN